MHRSIKKKRLGGYVPPSRKEKVTPRQLTERALRVARRTYTGYKGTSCIKWTLTAAWFGCRVERSYLQAPAGHPIRVGLGLAGKRLGSKGQARPFGRWGLGRAEVSPLVRKGSMPMSAPVPWGMQRGRGVSGPLAKMCETQWRSHVVTHTSCGMR
jgi:hypothetical protein